MIIWIRQHADRFDFMHPDELQYQIALQIRDGEESHSISELFNDEQGIDGWLPSEVAELILDRAEHYLYNGRLPEIKEKVAWIREHAVEIDNAYLYGQIANHQQQIDKLKSRLFVEE